MLILMFLLQIGHEPLPPYKSRTIFGREKLFYPSIFSYSEFRAAGMLKGLHCLLFNDSFSHTLWSVFLSLVFLCLWSVSLSEVFLCLWTVSHSLQCFTLSLSLWTASQAVSLCSSSHSLCSSSPSLWTASPSC